MLYTLNANYFSPCIRFKKSFLQLLKDQGSIPLKYREIGRRIGEKYPQTVKHHIARCKKKLC